MNNFVFQQLLVRSECDAVLKRLIADSASSNTANPQTQDPQAATRIWKAIHYGPAPTTHEVLCLLSNCRLEHVPRALTVAGEGGWSKAKQAAIAHGISRLLVRENAVSLNQWIEIAELLPRWNQNSKPHGALPTGPVQLLLGALVRASSQFRGCSNFWEQFAIILHGYCGRALSSLTIGGLLLSSTIRLSQASLVLPASIHLASNMATLLLTTLCHLSASEHESPASFAQGSSPDQSLDQLLQETVSALVWLDLLILSDKWLRESPTHRPTHARTDSRESNSARGNTATLSHDEDDEQHLWLVTLATRTAPPELTGTSAQGPIARPEFVPVTHIGLLPMSAATILSYTARALRPGQAILHQALPSAVAIDYAIGVTLEDWSAAQPLYPGRSPQRAAVYSDVCAILRATQPSNAPPQPDPGLPYAEQGHDYPVTLWALRSAAVRRLQSPECADSQNKTSSSVRGPSSLPVPKDFPIALRGDVHQALYPHTVDMQRLQTVRKQCYELICCYVRGVVGPSPAAEMAVAATSGPTETTAGANGGNRERRDPAHMPGCIDVSSAVSSNDGSRLVDQRLFKEAFELLLEQILYDIDQGVSVDWISELARELAGIGALDPMNDGQWLHQYHAWARAVSEIGGALPVSALFGLMEPLVLTPNTAQAVAGSAALVWQLLPETIVETLGRRPQLSESATGSVGEPMVCQYPSTAAMRVVAKSLQWLASASQQLCSDLAAALPKDVTEGDHDGSPGRERLFEAVLLVCHISAATLQRAPSGEGLPKRSVVPAAHARLELRWDCAAVPSVAAPEMESTHRWMNALPKSGQVAVQAIVHSALRATRLATSLGLLMSKTEDTSRPGGHGIATLFDWLGAVVQMHAELSTKAQGELRRVVSCLAERTPQDDAQSTQIARWKRVMHPSGSAAKRKRPVRPAHRRQRSRNPVVNEWLAEDPRETDSFDDLEGFIVD